MTRHDEIRLLRARECDRANPEALDEAIVGLQSTDCEDPEFRTLHDELQAVRERLEPELQMATPRDRGTY